MLPIVYCIVISVVLPIFKCEQNNLVDFIPVNNLRLSVANHSTKSNIHITKPNEMAEEKTKKKVEEENINPSNQIPFRYKA